MSFFACLSIDLSSYHFCYPIFFYLFASASDLYVLFVVFLCRSFIGSFPFVNVNISNIEEREKENIEKIKSKAKKKKMVKLSFLTMY